jgi:hypothetical protein
MGGPHQPARPATDLDPTPRRAAPEIPWIHRDHTHHPFNEHTWNHIRTTITHYTGHDSATREADLADALDQLMRRARNQTSTVQEQRLLTRATSTRAPVPTQPGEHDHLQPEPGTPRAGHQAQDDSLDDFDDTPDEDTINDDSHAGPATRTGYGLYDAAAEALKW